ncbi:MAG: exonuclease domain-containing protein [Chthoniobacterales bacterium]
MTTRDTPAGEAVWAAVDFESTGVSPGQTDEPVQVGLAVWPGTAEAPGDLFRSYVRSAARITRSARAVHGIADGEVADAPPMSALWPEFKWRLSGAVVVAHGAGTEKRFLRAFPLHGFGPWLDTLALSRAALPGLPDHALGSVVAALGLEGRVQELCPGLGWHDALFDAVASLLILRHLIAELDLSRATVGQLISLDRGAYDRRRALVRTVRGAGWPESHVPDQT